MDHERLFGVSLSRREDIIDYISYRNAEEADDLQLAKFLVETFSITNHDKVVLDTMCPDRVKELSATKERRENGLVRVLEIGSSIVGTYSLHNPGAITSGSWEDGAYYFSSLAIHPKLQGLGIGRVLLLEAKARVRHKGEGVLTLHVNENALRLQKFYETLDCVPDKNGDCQYFGITWKGFKSIII